MTTKQIDLGLTFRAWQIDAMKDMARFRFYVLPVHRRGGKTFLATALLAIMALAKPRSKLAYIAPTRSQGVDITNQLFADLIAHIPGAKIVDGGARVELPNGSTIGIYSAEHHLRMRGLGFDFIVCDEPAQFPPGSWEGSIRPTLSAGSDGKSQGGALFIGTPMGIDPFFELWQLAEQGVIGWGGKRYPAWPENATGVLSASEIEAAAAESVSRATFEREYGVSFEASTDDVLIPLELAAPKQKNRAPANWQHDRDITRWPAIMGVDVAGGGADETVITIRQGRIVHDFWVFSEDDQHSLPGRVIGLWRQYGVQACFVDAGGGYASHLLPVLQNAGFDPVAVQPGGKATNDTRWLNKRAEMWFKMKEWLADPNVVIPPGQRILADLTAPRIKFTAKGALQLEAKQDIRKRLGRSPDRGDALALTFAHEVAMPVQGLFSGRQSGVRYQSDYRGIRIAGEQSSYVHDPYS